MPDGERVDPDDDSIYRFVVYHYRFDPDRKQRRQTVVAAFDNDDEGVAEAERRALELALSKARGLAEEVEWISGAPKEPGYRERMRRQRRGES